MIDMLLLDAATAQALATASGGRLQPLLVQAGARAGSCVVPARVLDDPEHAPHHALLGALQRAEINPDAAELASRDYAVPALAAAAPPPDIVSRKQMLIALHVAGKLDAIEGFVNSPGQDRIVQLAWREAKDFYRSDELLNQMAPMLGLTAEDVDELFRSAAQVP